MDEQHQQEPSFGDVETPQERPEGVSDGSAGAGVPHSGLNEPQDVTERLGFSGKGVEPERPTVANLAPEAAMHGQVTDAVHDVMRPLFADAMSRLSHGEKVNWTIGAVMVPHPQNPAMGVMCPALYVEMPSAVLDTVETQNLIFQQFAGWTQEMADEATHQALEMCRQQRSARYAEAMGQKASTNGHSPGSGLILPPGLG